MAKISGKETKPEILVRKYLFAQGLRFRKNVKSLSGTPDIVLPKYRCVIFVHGCFWHGHKDCPKAKLPQSNTSFWQRKIASNSVRDKKNANVLGESGWHVVEIWQCSLSNKVVRQKTLTELVRKIKKLKPAI